VEQFGDDHLPHFSAFSRGNKCDLSSKKVVSYDEAKDCYATNG
jgi:hypothetical protein